MNETKASNFKVSISQSWIFFYLKKKESNKKDELCRSITFLVTSKSRSYWNSSILGFYHWNNQEGKQDINKQHNETNGTLKKNQSSTSSYFSGWIYHLYTLLLQYKSQKISGYIIKVLQFANNTNIQHNMLQAYAAEQFQKQLTKG